MRILDRYLVREFLHSLSLTICALLGIYLIIEIFEKIDELVKYGLSLPILFKYLFFSLPKIFFQLSPVAFLLAVLLTLSLMARQGELMALKASGVSLYRLALVFLVMAGLFSLFTFVCNERLLPPSNQLALYYKKMIEGKKPEKNLPQSRIWIWNNKRSILNIQLVDVQSQEVQGLTLFAFDAKFRLLQRVDAQRGVFREEKWYLYDGIERTFTPNNPLKITFREFTEEVFPISHRLDDIFARQKRPEEMGYRELFNYIQRLKGVGYPVNKYLVDLHSKISMPLIPLILTLIGLPFAVKIERSARLFHIGSGLLISFIYWLIFHLSLSFGQTGLISPLLAAWLGNSIFFLVGMYLFFNLPT